MPNPSRPLAFVLAATERGAMIVNRFDRCVTPHEIFGVGFQLLEHGAYDPGEGEILLELLNLRRRHYGDGVVAVDCGANIGVRTVEWAKHMAEWGVVVAFEAQERLYYALAGNITINNCFNARAIHAAVANRSGTMKMPKLNYSAPASFGSLELKRRTGTEFIGQTVEYDDEKMVDVRTATLDSFNFPRLDLLKIDVEGMELDTLTGAAACIGSGHPIVFVETIKSDAATLRAWLEALGYIVVVAGKNFLAVHRTDKCLAQIKFGAAAAA
jgi:FkbM family methyltransferase